MESPFYPTIEGNNVSVSVPMDKYYVHLFSKKILLSKL